MSARPFENHYQATNALRGSKRLADRPQVEIVPIESVKPVRRNARTHSKKQIQQIANSMLQFGCTNPILTDENGVVIAGHGRLKASELLGLRKVPVIVISGLSETEKRALALADNKIAANSGLRAPNDWTVLNLPAIAEQEERIQIGVCAMSDLSP